MKTFIKETDQAPFKPYPKLMHRIGSPNEIIIASSGTSGVALTDGPSQKTGELLNDIDNFVDFEGELQLKND